MTHRPWLPLVSLALACSAQASPHELLVGGPCEGCDAVFVGRPARLAPASTIAPATEAGDRMVIAGTVRDAKARPVGGVIVYAYHTSASGQYPSAGANAGHRHGRLRGFARTASDGTYTFTTIRPAAYSAAAPPAHVHMHVVEPRRCHYYIDDLVFTDDPLLTPLQREAHSSGRGGIGVATPTRDTNGVWHVRRDITLGAGIADYDRCR